MFKIKPGWFGWMAFLLVAGCQSIGPLNPSANPTLDPILDESVNDYLVNHIGFTSHDGTVFCAYELLNVARAPEGDIYLWALCQEYYLDQGSLTPGGGISLPVALQKQENNERPEIVGHLIPGDGSHYGPDVRVIFPRSTWKQIMPQGEEGINQYNTRASRLQEETRQQAREYYSMDD